MSGTLQTGGHLALSQGLSPSLMNRFAHKGTAQTVDKASKDFESMFLTQMLQPMFDTVGVDHMFGGGHGEEMMRGFLVQEYGKALAANSHFGIAQAVHDEMIRVQEKSSANSQTTSSNGATNVTGQAQ